MWFNWNWCEWQINLSDEELCLSSYTTQHRIRNPTKIRPWNLCTGLPREASLGCYCYSTMGVWLYNVQFPYTFKETIHRLNYWSVGIDWGSYGELFFLCVSCKNKLTVMLEYYIHFWKHYTANMMFWFKSEYGKRKAELSHNSSILLLKEVDMKGLMMMGPDSCY